MGSAEVEDLVFQYSDGMIFRCMELLILMITYFVIAKYVFLENMVRGRKKWLFYGGVAVVMLLFDLYGATVLGDWAGEALGENVLEVAVIWAIMYGRKDHRWVVFPEFVAIAGLTLGIRMPIILLPSRLMEKVPDTAQLYRAFAYSIILTGYGFFWYFGRKWRRHFDEEVQNRHLARWEHGMLFGVGILLSFFYMIMGTSLEDEIIASVDVHLLAIFAVLLSVSGFVIALTVIIVVLIGNKQNYYHHRVSDMQFNIIVMMAEIVENRDENTGGHIQRTARYVEIIARQLKKDGMFKDVLTNAYIRDMVVAAPLHDIGKIHVSDLILNKPDRLTEEEFAIMKTHAAEGRNLLQHAKGHLGDFSYLDVAVQMAGAHHEWWDGSAKGYPEQTKGEEIPLCARIMAVADVFDALTSRRCYKEPMPVKKAYTIILGESGTHFDPRVVDAFVASRRQVEEALQEFLQEPAILQNFHN